MGFIKSSTLTPSESGGIVEILMRSATHPCLQEVWYLLTLTFYHCGCSGDGSEWSEYGLSRRIEFGVLNEVPDTDGFQSCQLDREILTVIQRHEEESLQAMMMSEDYHSHDND